MNLNPTVDRLYHPSWLTEAHARELELTLKNLAYREYKYRASRLKRAPKLEFYLPFADGSIPVYRWGQNRTEYSSGQLITKFPSLDAVRKRVTNEFGECCNHCIVIKYSDGERHHAPPHHDRQQGVPGNGAHDMAADSSFFVVTLGFARPFQILDNDLNIAWEERLPHGSLLQVTADLNRTYYHAVPRAPTQPNENPRFSVIFRTIAKSSFQPACAG